jgi:16S rRNA (guanine966-N2)-methyltransferase
VIEGEHVRIIAGEWRGRRLRAPQDRSVRPTPDRVRESLFSILGPDPLRGAVLDLFAGTGALGLEALSRGAPSATFVETSRAALELLRANVEALRAGERARILARSALDLRLAPSPTTTFSLILADPPYAMLETAPSARRLVSLLTRLVEDRILAESGVLVLEHRRSTSGPDVPGLRVFDRREYGETGLTLYEIPPDRPPVTLSPQSSPMASR